MADVAADLREAVRGVLGPLEVATLTQQVLDYGMLVAVRDETSRRLLEATTDTHKAQLLGVRSLTQRLLREFDPAESDAKQALEHAESVGVDTLEAPARVRLGQVYRMRGDHQDADRMFALAEMGELPKRLIGRVLAIAALSCIAQDRLTEALVHIERAIEYTADEFTTSVAEPALEIVYRRAPAGFGPASRSWDERAGFPFPRRFQDPHTGKWGFLDKDRTVVVPPKYDDVGDFRGGVAAVKTGGWGAIDTTGAQAVPFLYDRMRTPLPDGRSVTGFVNGMAVVDRRGTKGVVNRSGRLIVPPHHRDIVIHPSGFAVTRGGDQWGARDRSGDELLPPQYDRRTILRRLDALLEIDDGPL
ncbi:WG repeat-containing protein [Stackebrandtia soli]|uniref:WG repeat-containing protein n=1 Tax=Stackebrandtia soli TaxID=1892856 RepID=UPI0039EAA8E0